MSVTAIFRQLTAWRTTLLATFHQRKSMTTIKDQFNICIALRHPSRSAEGVSEALALKPLARHAVGDRFGGLQAKRTYFYARLQEGDMSSDYEDALSSVALFLENNAAFWADFTGEGGEVELVLNHTICRQDEEGDQCFEISLAPAFLSHLSTRGIGLRVQGWQGRVKRKKSTLARKRANIG